MSSSLTLKVTSALSRDGVSCEASNPHGNDRHVFHFGTVAPRPPRPEWRSWPWLSAWASCSSSLLLSTA